MNSKNILIAEDEKPLSHALALKLQHAGYNVITAADGQECLEKLKEQPIDVLLLDLIMPTQDGFQVLEQVQKLELPKKPTIFVLSNLSQHTDEQRALELGARKFFIKSNTSLNTIVDEITKLAL